MASDKFKNHRDPYLGSDMYIYACQYNSNPSRNPVPLKIIYQKRPAAFAVVLLAPKPYPLITQSQNDHHLTISRSFFSLCVRGLPTPFGGRRGGGKVGPTKTKVKNRVPLLIYFDEHDEHHTILCLRSVLILFEKKNLVFRPMAIFVHKNAKLRLC